MIGGGRTNTKFVDHLTHLYITPHPILFGDGIKLFTKMPTELKLQLVATIAVDEKNGIFQYQYKVIR